MEVSHDIRTELIDPSPVLLRVVNKLCQEYLDMVADFQQDGHFGNSILVRPLPGGRYQVVDGMYRWTAGHEAGLKVFQCIVREMDDKEVLIWQIKLNATRKDTDPIEYARHLRRLLDVTDNEMELKDIAELIGKSRSWVSEMLSLNNLRDEFKRLVQRGQITVSNAQLLAKLKPYLQPDHVEAARTETTAEFRKTVSAALNRFRESLKKAKVEQFWSEEIKPYVRNLKEINKELSTWQAGARMIAQHNCVSPLDGWKLAVQWLMNMDPDMLEFRKAKMQRAELEKLEELERLEALRDGRKHAAFGDADTT